MRFPSTLACILVFVFWLTYELRKNSSSAKKEKSFLELDAEANSVRKKPLDTLHYITIPIESLPFFSGIDEKLTSYQERSEERRGGTECGGGCRSRWSPDH